MNYYYLIATLPMLQFEEKPRISYDDFQATCEVQLSLPHMAALRQLQNLATKPENLGKSEARHSFVDRWEKKEIEIRNAIARERAKKLGREHLETRDAGISDVALDKAVTEAISMDNPLKKEKAIDRLRWEETEKLTGLDPFSTESVFAYAVKLIIAQRWAGLYKEEGRGILEKIVNLQLSGQGGQK